MAGFSQDLPTSTHHHLQSSSPQLIFQRLSTTSNTSLSPSSSATEMDLMRNRVLQMQTLAMTEKEVILLPIRHRSLFPFNLVL